ncbi:MAG: hypothetical protein M3Y56_06275 [Armatimonadota bacterium]|nr:hypothetical protein [Armatimonadota bacterium]
MTETSKGKQIELIERPGDLYARPTGPIIRLYPRPIIKMEKGDRPATDEERRAITAPVLERMRLAHRDG